jgi:hypothetical protein
MQAAARVDHFMAVEGRQTCSLDDNWFVSTLGLPPWQLELSPCAPAESLVITGDGSIAVASCVCRLCPRIRRVWGPALGIHLWCHHRPRAPKRSECASTALSLRTWCKRCGCPIHAECAKTGPRSRLSTLAAMPPGNSDYMRNVTCQRIQSRSKKRRGAMRSGYALPTSVCERYNQVHLYA